MKLIYNLLPVIFVIIIPKIAFSISVDEFLGCYQDANSLKSSESFRIEKDQMKIGDTEELGKIVPFIGEVILSEKNPYGGSVYKIKNDSSNWLKVGESTLRFDSEEYLTEVASGVGVLRKMASFTIDQNQNLVVQYNQIIFSEPFSIKETGFVQNLKRIPCVW